MSFRGSIGIADSQFGDIGVQAELLLQAGACAASCAAKTGTLPASRPRRSVSSHRSTERAAHRERPLLPHCSHGVHLGQEDGPLPALAALASIGRSTHSLPRSLKRLLRAPTTPALDPSLGPRQNPTQALLGIERFREAVAPNSCQPLEAFPRDASRFTGTARLAISAVGRPQIPEKPSRHSASSD